jgi:hypothetical protein
MPARLSNLDYGPGNLAGQKVISRWAEAGGRTMAFLAMSAI